MAEKRLTKEIAEQFLADEDSVNLEKFTELDDAAAKVISEYKGRCLFLGVTSLSDVPAESLCKFEGWRLRLNGLTNLSDEATESLSNHPSFANKD